MKKHLLFAVALLACISSKTFAQQHHHGNHAGQNHHNGGGYYQPNQNNFSVLKFSVQNPFRTIAIIDGQNYGAIQNLYNGVNLAVGKHCIQLFKKGNRQGSMMIFNGEVWLKPNTVATATFDYYNGLVVTQQPIFNTTCNNDDEYDNYPQPCVAPIICAVDERTFCQFKNVVKNAWFDSDKQKMICDFLNKNYVNSYQVEQLLTLIDFESTKLKIAKEAYTKVIDKNNYYTVFTQFDFESSKRELSDYMARC
ncbi:MAG: hypothetical protein RI955_597 [Bacteroidota bacterium]|jgi:hypothetical protein